MVKAIGLGKGLCNSTSYRYLQEHDWQEEIKGLFSRGDASRRELRLPGKPGEAAVFRCYAGKICKI